MLKRIVLWSALLMSACAAATAGSPAQNVMDRFVAEVAAEWPSYDVTQHVAPRENREAFARRAFRWESGLPGSLFESREVHVSQGDGTPALHLGIVHLRFPSAEGSASTYQGLARQDGQFLAGTKILTRYVVARNGDELLIAYSETHRQPRVEKFLRGLESAPAGIWGK